MKLTYDFHIHSALSPCALDEMTPNNIVNMALISNLDVIAITDHNSAKNVESIMNVAKDTSLVVLPGMEVESREEIHIVCLFSCVNDVMRMQELVYANLTMLKNKPKVLGSQLILDTEDEMLGTEDRLLSFATKLSFEEVIMKADEFGGIAIPAHIDRPSYSVISNLGMIPEDSKLTCLEISQYADFEEYKKKYKSYRLLQSSDSHELGFIGVSQRTIDIEGTEKTPKHIIEFLKSQQDS
jgi:3',5'-nucleoside bisphosphate phosphatase